MQKEKKKGNGKRIRREVKEMRRKKKKIKK